jgi:hypothetical protein
MPKIDKIKLQQAVDTVKIFRERWLEWTQYDPIEKNAMALDTLLQSAQAVLSLPSVENDIKYLGKGEFECRHVKEDTIVEDCPVCNLHAADAQIKYLKDKPSVEGATEVLRRRLEITNRTLNEMLNQYRLLENTGLTMAIRAVIKYNEEAFDKIPTTKKG